MATTAAEANGAAADRGRINWDTVVQVVGAGAAIATWVAVVGGGRVWARLHAAEVPATQTLAVLPRQLLLVEGLQTLLAPLLIGAFAALVVYFSWSSEEAWRSNLERKGEAEWQLRKAEQAAAKKRPEEKERERQSSGGLPDPGERQASSGSDRSDLPTPGASRRSPRLIPGASTSVPATRAEPERTAE